MKKTFLLSIFLLHSVFVFSQYNQANIWYFNNGNGIDFNTNSPKALNNHVFMGGRISTICDNNGKLLFYTDGMTVLGKNHKIIKNGKGLLGQADVMIVPFPQNKNLYYIFSVSVYDNAKSEFGKVNFEKDTINLKEFSRKDWWEEQKLKDRYNQKNSRLYYHIVDISKNNGLGEVIEKNKLVYQKIKADLVVARHANNKDYWLITHEFMTNKFKVFLINEKGLQEKPIETEIGMKLYDEYNVGSEKGNEKLRHINISNNFQKIALYDGTHKKMQVFNFDNEMGKITNFFTIKTDEGLIVSTFAFCFSPDASKLYVTHRNMWIGKEEPFIYFRQYNLNIKNEEDILKKRQTREIYWNKKRDYFIEGDMEIGYNQKMYFSRYISQIGEIENPNDILDSIKINFSRLNCEMSLRWYLPKVAHLLPPFYSPIKLGDLFQREILFETGKYDLKTWHYPILTDIVKFLKENPKTTINIFGHTDNEGKAQANKNLSLQRAKAVENYFISQSIAKNRIISEGFGDTKPLLDNSTPENKRKNRRIEFLVKAP